MKRFQFMCTCSFICSILKIYSVSRAQPSINHEHILQCEWSQRNTNRINPHLREHMHIAKRQKILAAAQLQNETKQKAAFEKKAKKKKKEIKYMYSHNGIAAKHSGVLRWVHMNHQRQMRQQWQRQRQRQNAMMIFGISKANALISLN